MKQTKHLPLLLAALAAMAASGFAEGLATRTPAVRPVSAGDWMKFVADRMADTHGGLRVAPAFAEMADAHGWQGEHLFVLESLSWGGPGWKDCYRIMNDHDRAGSRIYYRLLGDGSVVPLAESWGYQNVGYADRKPFDGDFFADLDGDGVTELICPVCYSADGAQDVFIYRLAGGGSEVCGTEDLLSSVFADYSPSNQIWVAASGIWPSERQPADAIAGNDPEFECVYDVPAEEKDAASGGPPIKSVKRRFRLKGKPLRYVPFVWERETPRKTDEETEASTNVLD